MGTNYYRIPTEEECEERKIRLMRGVFDLKMSLEEINNDFNTYLPGTCDSINPWTEFEHGMKIHIGKSSMGWKFCFNHNNWKFYKNITELKKFIKNGRLIDEYGRLEEPKEFWNDVNRRQKNKNMMDAMDYYQKFPKDRGIFDVRDSEKIIEGYRFSTSTEFC